MSAVIRDIPVFCSDLEMLQKLFVPDQEHISVFDPLKRIKNVTSSSVTLTRSIPEFGICIDLSGKAPNGEMCTLYIGGRNAYSTRWYYINNNDGTLRWIYPVENDTPAFLDLYNATSLKARAFKMITKLAWNFGQKKSLAHGVIIIDDTLIKSLRDRCEISEEENFTLFTGTRGATRKVVMEITNGRNVSGFIKIPAGQHSNQNILNENSMLNSLRKYDFTTLSIPTISQRVNGHARLGNVKPAVIIAADKINTIHLRAVAELYAFNHSECRIQESKAWDVIRTQMDYLQHDLTFTNGLPEAKTKKIIRLLRKLYNSIQVTEKIPVSISHGDFTPWNMYCDEQRLFVYDWEMASSGMPMLFDLFHFTFQSTILSRNKTYREVAEGIRNWNTNPESVRLIRKYNINTDLHYRLYLLFTVSYYIRQYIGEKELLMQSQWMIDAWLEALQELVPESNKSLS